jgi:pyruvate dehydrogenase E1 component alpha subunit
MSPELAYQLHNSMLRIRRIEEALALRYAEQEMRCPMHLCIGQEAIASGVSSALKATDRMYSNHRAHGHYLAKGGSLNAMIAELYGRASGCCGGRGGSMHMIDLDVGFMGATPIVGGTVPLAVGSAWASQLQKKSDVTVIFFGDGCIEEGSFYESVNFAAVRKLPVLFVCENNFYSVYSPLSVRQPKGREIFKMVEALGVKSSIADGNNVEQSFSAAKQAVGYIKSGNGPFFLELTTYRWREHCGPNYDNNIGYRSEEEFLNWKAKDPILAYKNVLLERNWATHSEMSQIEQHLVEEIENAFLFAENSNFPDQAEAFTDEYASNKEHI